MAEEKEDWLYFSNVLLPGGPSSSSSGNASGNSSSEDRSKDDEDDGRNEDIAKWEMALLALMFSVAVLGNSLVLIALVLRRHQKLSRMYYFILHLCVSDLIVAFFHILPQLCWEITYRFRGNNFLCKVTKFSQLLGPYLSSYILVATAIDRYLAICFPLANNPWTVRHSKIMIWVAWVVALLLSLPQMFIFSYRQIPDSLDWDCWGEFVQPYGEVAYITWYSVANTLLPLVVLLYTYTAICWAVYLNFRGKKREQQASALPPTPATVTRNPHHHHQTPTPPPPQNGSKYKTSIEKPSSEMINPRSHSTRTISRAKIKTVKLTIVVITCYIFCSMPYSCVMLWTVYSPNVATSSFYRSTWYALLTLLASLNSCVNPWVYLAFNDNLMESLRNIFCCSTREEPPTRHFMTTNCSRTSLSDSGAKDESVRNGGTISGWLKPRGRRRSDHHGNRNSEPRRSLGEAKAVSDLTNIADEFVDERTVRLLLQATPSPREEQLVPQTAPPSVTNSEGELASSCHLVPTHHQRASASTPNFLICSREHNGDSDADKCACEQV